MSVYDELEHAFNVAADHLQSAAIGALEDAVDAMRDGRDQDLAMWLQFAREMTRSSELIRKRGRNGTR